MPRNRSEKLPSSPEAHAYMRFVEERGAEAAISDRCSGEREALWFRLPAEVVNAISFARDEAVKEASFVDEYVNDVGFNAAYIRKHYAP